jgi:hypothetical protein
MSTWVAFGIVLAIALIAVVLVSVAIRDRRQHAAVRRSASQSGNAQTDDATGYVPGVWMLGGAESAAPGGHAHHHGADAAGAHTADVGGGDSGGGH